MKKILAWALILVVALPVICEVHALEIERPNRAETINKTLSNSKNDLNASVRLGVEACGYHDDPNPPYDAQNTVNMNISMIGSTRMSIAYVNQTVDNDAQFFWMYEYGGGEVVRRISNVEQHYYEWVCPPLNFNFKYFGFKYRNCPLVDNSSCYLRVSSDGFVSFDVSNSSEYPASFPSRTYPNAVIAPLWTDLVVDSQSEIIVIAGACDFLHVPHLVIIWKNVKHIPDDVRLTFTLGLEYYRFEQYDPAVDEGFIYMRYDYVTSLSGSYVYGIEDLEGEKGVGALLPGTGLESLQDKVIIFHHENMPMQYAKNLILSIQDSNYANAAYDILDQDGLVRGFNLRAREDRREDSSGKFIRTVTSAVNTGASIGLHYAAEAGVSFAQAIAFPLTAPVSVILVIWGFYDLYTKMQYDSIDWGQLEEHPSGANPAFIRVPPSHEDITDASLNIGFVWEFLDDQTGSHNLTITAKLEYGWSEQTSVVETSVSIWVGPDTNNGLGTASKIQEGAHGDDRMLFLSRGGCDTVDYYNVSLGYKDVVNVSMMPPDYVKFYMEIFRPNDSAALAYSDIHGPGVLQAVNFTADIAGNWSIRMDARDGGDGFYHLNITIRGKGDITQNGVIDILDAILLSEAFGSSPGVSDHDPDLNRDGTVNILDAITLSMSFGQKQATSGAGSGRQAFGGRSTEGSMLGLPNIFVDPSQIALFKGEIFNASVRLSDVVDLAGWEFQLYWNSTLLNCTNVAIQSPNEWQGTTQDYGPGLEAAYNATHARFWTAETANYPAPSFNGSMTIATLTFKALQTGTTSLSLTETTFGNSTADPIDHTESSGSVTVYFGRYMRSDTQQVNGLSAYKLNIPQSTSAASYTQSGSGAGASFGIRTWVRHSNGVEQEISLDGQTGTPKAIVGGGSGAMRSSTVSVAQTALQSTDSLVIRVYVQIAEGPWNLCASFTTEQLQSSTLKAATWTMYYYTSSTYNHWTDRTTAKFYWGTTTYNSRVQNLQYN